ncbi:MAG: hypothetical protein PHI18_10015 [bacterium]|nr:hypothetical protein [bacterium]
MHYTDLILRTTDLPPGRHVIYEFPEGTIVLANVGLRHPDLAPRDEFRLVVLMDGRELTPRHGDFFADFQLKIEARPDLRLALAEACEQICNGQSPLSMIASKHLPTRFAETGEATWHLQTSMDQTAGLPTALCLCGLQTLIRVYELNDFLPNAPEAFRAVFLGLEQGQPLPQLLRTLQPQVKPGHRYFDRLER